MGTAPRNATYTTKQLAEMASVSPRTLRYYDQVGLLVPQRGPNGYRAYGPAEVRRLQHILMLRTCGLPLDAIAIALDGAGRDLGGILADHLGSLRRQSEQLERSIAIVEQAIAGLKEFEAMDDKQRFEQLKRQAVDQAEQAWGAEARERYGDDAVDDVNGRLMAMGREDWDDKEALEQHVIELLAAALEEGDPRSERAAELAAAHARWITMHWGEAAYTPEAHRALAQGYLADPRFIAYYDEAAGEGATAFLAQAVEAHIG